MKLVAIDIETTGLDLERDAMIEIAAARFENGKVLEEFSTFINPNRPIPTEITHLTGITNAMVKSAPQLYDALVPFVEFVALDAVIGHNVAFDLGFLRKCGALKKNKSYDTYELASAFVPRATRYNLTYLAQQLNILPEGQHRALEDCRTTQKVYQRIIEKIDALPLDLLLQLNTSALASGWSADEIIQERVRSRIKYGEKRNPTYRFPIPHFTQADMDFSQELKPADVPEKLDIDETAAILEYGGEFQRHFPNYEARTPQIEMLRSVTHSLNESVHMFVEAGTGTGKSFAYLIPSFLWAIKNGQRIVISTNTKNLQDQLINKDIPELRSALGINLCATVQKGRGNYLCTRRLHQLAERGAETPEEMRVLTKVLVWITEDGNGDRTEINLNGPIERELFEKLSADHETCRANICVFRRRGECPFYSVRDRAQRSHIIIVNHALLFADMAVGGTVLPEYNYLIVDEGHHLESAATGALSVRITPFELAHLLQETGSGNSGQIGRLLNAFQGVVTADNYVEMAQSASELTQLSAELEIKLRGLFQTVSLFATQARDGNPPSRYGQQLRITPAARTIPGWSDIEIDWDNARNIYKDYLTALKRFRKHLPEINDTDEDQAELIGGLESLESKLSETKKHLENFIMAQQPNDINWIEAAARNGRIALNIAPLAVGPMVEKLLWHEKECVIVTSATLAADNSFEYIHERLCADEASDVTFDSPFDHENSVLLYIPNDIPEPNHYNMQKTLEKTLVDICKVTHGRTLTLFTSYAQLKTTSNAISGQLNSLGITVFEQGEGISATALLAAFRNTEQAILLGTRSFWEGVDIQGEALSVVVIVKLPFDVPSDPIFAARSENYDNSFAQYSLPEAILKFRQGFGRLIRSKSDRGAVVILDNRVLTKRYGREFINSIPKCTERVNSIRDLPAAIKKWLNL